MKTPGGGAKHTWQLTDADIQQIWAEALHLVRAGEKLYLDAALEALAKGEQRDAMEHDEREGLVRVYLDRLLPDKWDEMDVYERRGYLADKDAPTSPRGVQRREYVSNAEIWSECLGRNIADLKPVDSYALAALMAKAGGWERSKDMRRLAIYGRQRLYRRVCSKG